MNFADPKWLEILKAKGWQLAGISLGCMLLVWMFKTQTISTTDSVLWVAVPAVTATILGCLAIASIVSKLAEVFELERTVKEWMKVRKEVRIAREYIPYMTEKDKKIIGYLLFKNQRVFQHESDGGYAAPLIAKGIIKVSHCGRQPMLERWVPFEVPMHIWAELDNNKHLFPYKPPKDRKEFVYPWAIHWMLK
mgnify:CR=1 FL=1